MPPLSPELQAREIELEEEIRRMLAANRDLASVLDDCRRGEPRVGPTPINIQSGLRNSVYRRKPVSVRQFIYGKGHLNLPSGDGGVSETMVAALENLYAGSATELMLVGSSSMVRRTFAALVFCFDAYRLTCLRKPEVSYGLLPQASLHFLNLSVTKPHADRVFFAEFYELVRNSHYFRNVHRFQKRANAELTFGRQIHCYAVPATVKATLGVNVFTAFLDETTSMSMMRRSRRRSSGRTRAPAEELYCVLRARMRSRFSRQGLFAGHLIASCSSFSDRFVERRFQEAQLQVNRGQRLMVILNADTWEAVSQAPPLPVPFDPPAPSIW